MFKNKIPHAFIAIAVGLFPILAHANMGPFATILLYALIASPFIALIAIPSGFFYSFNKLKKAKAAQDGRKIKKHSILLILWSVLGFLFLGFCVGPLLVSSHLLNLY